MLLRSVSSEPAPSGPELPGRIRVAKWGRNKSTKGDYTINETTLRALPHVQRAMGFDTVDLDFNHNTVPGSPAYKADKEPRHRAAFGPLDVVSGEGVFLNVRAWTPQGDQAVKGRHFQDLSPSIVTNSAGEVLFIHSVALCRQGCTEDLELQLNSADFAELYARLRTHSAAFSASPAMDKYKLILLSLLSLPETADDAAIEAGAKGLAGKIDAATTAANQAKAAADGATSEIKTMSADLAKLRDLVSGSERAKLVTNSIAELPIDNLKKVLAELPAGVVPMERRTPEALKTHSAGVTGSDSLGSIMDRAAGLSEEDIKKYGGR